MPSKILIVEDFEPNSILTEALINECGYEADVAFNGKEAVKKARSGEYFIILMDLQMYGMNGFDATKKIRQLEAAGSLNRHFIIGMTAHSDDEQKCYASGMDDYLSKPFEFRSLQAKVISAILSLKKAGRTIKVSTGNNAPMK